MVLDMEVEIINRASLQRILYRNLRYKKYAVISFYGDNEQQINFTVNPNVKYIEKNINDLREVENPDNWHFYDFDQIAKFILECEDNGIEYIFCECETGTSRSAGCAMAIREFYYGDGIRVFSIYGYNPNPVFYNNIYNSLIRRDKVNKRKVTNKCIEESFGL